MHISLRKFFFDKYILFGQIEKVLVTNLKLNLHVRNPQRIIHSVGDIFNSKSMAITNFEQPRCLGFRQCFPVAGLCPNSLQKNALFAVNYPCPIMSQKVWVRSRSCVVILEYVLFFIMKQLVSERKYKMLNLDQALEAVTLISFFLVQGQRYVLVYIGLWLTYMISFKN